MPNNNCCFSCGSTPKPDVNYCTNCGCQVAVAEANRCINVNCERKLIDYDFETSDMYCDKCGKPTILGNKI